MSETEFREHCADLWDSEARLEHLLAVTAIGVNAIAGWFGESPFHPSAVVPWIPPRPVTGELTDGEQVVIESHFGPAVHVLAAAPEPDWGD